MKGIYKVAIVAVLVMGMVALQAGMAAASNRFTRPVDASDENNQIDPESAHLIVLDPEEVETEEFTIGDHILVKTYYRYSDGSYKVVTSYRGLTEFAYLSSNGQLVSYRLVFSRDYQLRDLRDEELPYFERGVFISMVIHRMNDYLGFDFGGVIGVELEMITFDYALVGNLGCAGQGPGGTMMCLGMMIGRALGWVIGVTLAAAGLIVGAVYWLIGVILRIISPDGDNDGDAGGQGQEEEAEDGENQENGDAGDDGDANGGDDGGAHEPPGGGDFYLKMREMIYSLRNSVRNVYNSYHLSEYAADMFDQAGWDFFQGGQLSSDFKLDFERNLNPVGKRYTRPAQRPGMR